MQETQKILMFIERVTGISVSPAHFFQVKIRIQSFLARSTYPSLEALHTALVHRPNRQLIQQLIDVIIVQESYFFRDIPIYNLLVQQLLPKRLEKQKTVHVWSAACALGQEPYSLAIRCIPHFSPAQVKIIASDISEQSILSAREGIYTYPCLKRSLSHSQITAYFKPHQDRWQLQAPIRSRVSFFVQNITYPFFFSHPIDIVLLRNVLLYVSLETKKEILNRMYRLLSPDGILILGSTELIDGRFKRHEWNGTVYFTPDQESK